MRLSRLAVPALFCITAALVGASLADPIVESLSNAGIFGSGHFTDRSMIDVAPVLLMGGLGALLWVIFQVRRALSPAPIRPRWLIEAAPMLGGRAIARLLPIILFLQAGVLFSMETLEQTAVYGHTLGPWIWLGAPAAFSLAIHALIGIAISLTLSAVLRRCSTSLLTVIRFIARLFSLLPRTAATFLRHACDPHRPHTFAPILCRIGERAPPRSAVAPTP